MKRSNLYYIYLATNFTNSVIYTGVTNNLVRRIYVHRNKLIKGFSSKYNVSKLVYFEEYDDINEAIRREKQIKSGSREKKIELVRSINPNFKDLYDELIS